MTRNALLGAFLALLGVSQASAVTYQAGDLFLGFRASNGSGSTKDYLVNIGQASQFTGSTPITLSVGNLATDLGSAGLFDTGWQTRGDVLWSVSGTTGQFAAVGTDPAKTLYATRPRAAVGTQSIPWDRDSISGQGITAGLMNGLANAYVSGTATPNSTVAIIQNTTSTNSYASYQNGGLNSGTDPASGISFQAFNPSIEGNFGAGTAGTVLDLYRLKPGTTADNGPGDLVGTFTIDDNAVVTFTPNTSTSIRLKSLSYSVSEEVVGGNLVVTVVRSGSTTGTDTATVTTSDLSAHAGTDYTAVNQVVTFNPGDSEATVNVPITPRAGYQGNRSFFVNLSGAAVIAAGTPAQATIVETAPQPTGTLSFTSATFNLQPTSPLHITLTRAISGLDNVQSTATAQVTMTGGTLVKGTDYTLNDPVTVTFAPGATTASLDIPYLTQASGTISLTLGTPSAGASIGATSTTTITVVATGTLSFGTKTFNVPQDAVNDQTVNVTVNRTNGTTGPASVDVVVLNSSTAVAGTDYTLPATSTLTWLDGDGTAKTFAVTIKKGSNIASTGVHIDLALQNATGAFLGTSTDIAATINIVGGDTEAPMLLITSPTPNQKLNGTVPITATVTDDKGVGHVDARIDGGAIVSLVQQTGTTTWSTSVAPGPGTHTLQIVGYDLAGNATSILSRTFSVLRSDLSGAYNGLVVAETALTSPVDYNGLLTVTVMPTGTFTGKAIFNGYTAGISGVVNGNGVFRFKDGSTTYAVVRPGRPDSTFIGYLSLNLDLSGTSKKVTGVLHAGVDPTSTTLATITHADLATYSRSNLVPDSIANATTDKGKYTVLFLAHGAPNNGLGTDAYPQGDGYGMMTVTKTSGAVLITGKTADGLQYTYRGTLAGSNDLPVFIQLYGTKGYLTGNVKFDSTATDSDAKGANFRWFKQTGVTTVKNYTAGFTKGIFVDFAASKYVAPTAAAANTALASASPTSFKLTLTDGGLTGTNEGLGTLDKTGKTTFTSQTPTTLATKATFVNASGALSGSFVHPGNSKADAFLGVAFQKTHSAGGYFIYAPTGGTAVSGGVAVQQQP